MYVVTVWWLESGPGRFPLVFAVLRCEKSGRGRGREGFKEEGEGGQGDRKRGDHSTLALLSMRKSSSSSSSFLIVLYKFGCKKRGGCKNIIRGIP